MKKLIEVYEVKELEDEYDEMCTILDDDCESCPYNNVKGPCKREFYKDRGYKLIIK